VADQEKVEKFRLTKEQMTYQKAYKRLLKMGQTIQQGIAQNMAKGVSLGQMLKEVSEGLNQLQTQAPKTPIQELEGQAPAAPEYPERQPEPTTAGVRN